MERPKAKRHLAAALHRGNVHDCRCDTNVCPVSEKHLVASADSSFRRRLMKNSACAESLSEVAVGGAHALAKLAQFTCDSVLLDRHLPDLDSAEVAELIRQRYPSTEVEFVDSKLDAAQPEECSRATGFESGKANADHSNNFGSPHLPDRDEIGHSRLRLMNPTVAEVAETLPGMLGKGSCDDPTANN